MNLFLSCSCSQPQNHCHKFKSQAESDSVVILYSKEWNRSIFHFYNRKLHVEPFVVRRNEQNGCSQWCCELGEHNVASRKSKVRWKEKPFIKCNDIGNCRSFWIELMNMKQSTPHFMSSLQGTVCTECSIAHNVNTDTHNASSAIVNPQGTLRRFACLHGKSGKKSIHFPGWFGAPSFRANCKLPKMLRIINLRLRVFSLSCSHVYRNFIPKWHTHTVR